MTKQIPLDQMSVDDLPLASDRTEAWSLLHDAGDVVRMKDCVIITSADAVEQAAKNPEVFSSARAFDSLGSPLPLVPIAVDPPDHARFRRLLDPFFSPRRMAAIEPQLRQQAGELIDKIAANGACELVSELTIPYPSQVFLTLFGLPLEDRERLLRWKKAILAFTSPSGGDPSPEVLEQGGELFSYLTQHIAERHETGGDDLLSQLIANRDEGGMTDEEILGLCFLFVLAGLDTVTSALGFSLAALAQDPEQRALIAGDFTLIPNFIEELLRVEVPVPWAPRVTTEEVQVAGTTLPAGTTVFLALGAANRDPSRFEDADAVHCDRRAPHFTFSRGPHRCLGSHLARLEMRIILEEWHRRIPDYRLAPGTKPEASWPDVTLGLKRIDLVF